MPCPKPRLPAFAFALALAASARLAAAELQAVCPEGCRITGDITRIVSDLTADGRVIEATWALDALPEDLRLRKLVMVALVTLENGKVLEGSKDLGTDRDGKAKVEVKGGFLGLNKGRREKATRAQVKLLAFAELKGSASPDLDVILASTHTMVGPTVSVVLEKNRKALSPCDTATGITIAVTAETDKGAKLEGKETFPLSISFAIVPLKGLGKRRADSLKKIVARAAYSGRTDLLCVSQKTLLLHE